MNDNLKEPDKKSTTDAVVADQPNRYDRKDKSVQYGIGVETTVEKLYELTCALYEEQDHSFNRFERLALFNMLYWQHKLVKLDEGLRPEGRILTCTEREAVDGSEGEWKVVQKAVKDNKAEDGGLRPETEGEYMKRITADTVRAQKEMKAEKAEEAERDIMWEQREDWSESSSEWDKRSHGEDSIKMREERKRQKEQEGKEGVAEGDFGKRKGVGDKGGREGQESYGEGLNLPKRNGSTRGMKMRRRRMFKRVQMIKSV